MHYERFWDTMYFMLLSVYGSSKLVLRQKLSYKTHVYSIFKLTFFLVNNCSWVLMPVWRLTFQFKIITIDLCQLNVKTVVIIYIWLSNQILSIHIQIHGRI